MDLSTTIVAIVALTVGTTFVLNVFADKLHRVCLPEPLLATVVGAVCGPHGFNFLSAFSGETNHILVEQACRFTLAVGIMGIALRLPWSYFKNNIRYLTLSLSLGMVVMWATATLLLSSIGGFPISIALLLGAIITPTDPVVASTIVTGEIAKKNVPELVRKNISAESAANDGLAYLFVMSAYFITASLYQQESIAIWFATLIFWEIGAACLLGGVLGYGAAKLLVYADQHELIERPSYLGYAWGLALLLVSGAKLLATDGVLAVFVGGVVFSKGITKEERITQEELDESINRYFLIPVFVLIGVVLPLEEWANIFAPEILIALLAAVVLRRVVMLAILGPLLRPVHSKAELCFMGWFGPIGVAAAFYSMHMDQRVGLDEKTWPYISLAVVLSVLVHGISATPLSKLLHLAKMHSTCPKGNSLS